MDLNFSIVWRNLDPLIAGLQTTLTALAIALAIGIPLALVVCAGSLRGHGLLHKAARVYVTVFRTIPEVVLIFWMFYCIPPITGMRVSGLTAGSLALGLVTGAYLSEIFRAGVQAVPRGQIEAARALGLRPLLTWSWIVAPQAFRITLPVTMNYFTELTKGTSLLATIGVAELALQAYVLGAQTFRHFEFLTAVAGAYLIVLLPIGLAATRLEQRLARAR